MLPVGGRVSFCQSAPPVLRHQVRAAETEGQLGQDYCTHVAPYNGMGAGIANPPPPPPPPPPAPT